MEKEVGEHSPISFSSIRSTHTFYFFNMIKFLLKFAKFFTVSIDYFF